MSVEFRVKTEIDEAMQLDISTLETLHPECSRNRAKLTKLAFSLAARYLEEQEFKRLAEQDDDDFDERMKDQFAGE